MKLVFDAKAISDIENIHRWIAHDSLAVATAVVERLMSSIERLSSFPQMGREGLDTGTREWVVPRLPYIVVYELDDAEIN